VIWTRQHDSALTICKKVYSFLGIPILSIFLKTLRMDPITGVAALAGLTVASIAGLRLKKQLNEGFNVLPQNTYEQSIGVSQTRYNPLMSMVNPISNPLLPVDATKEQVEKKQSDLNQALGSLLSPYDPASPEAFKLKDMMNRLKVRSDVKGGLFEAIKFCRETVEKNDRPFTVFKRDEFGNVTEEVVSKGAERQINPDETFKFDEICGVCLTSGVDETGKPFTGKRGMLADQNAKESAQKEQQQFQYPFPRVTPAMGKCEGSPNTPAFAIDAHTLQQYTMRNECMNAKEIKNIDDQNKCGLCYENDVYSVVPTRVQKNTISLVLMGTGLANIKAGNTDVKTNITLSASSPVSIPLVTSRVIGGVSRLLPVEEGSSFRIEVSQNPSKPDDFPMVWGYLQAINPNGGEFAMPLNLLLTRDEVTNSAPNRTGGFFQFPTNDIEVSKIRPGGESGNDMRLVGEIPFTFVQSSEFSSFDCPSAPYQTDANSVTRFASDQPCYAKGSRRGNYNDECLRERILAVGCTNGGDLYKNPKSLNTTDSGQPASLTQIYNKVKDIADSNMLDAEKTKLCTGKVIESPCDFFRLQPNMKMEKLLEGNLKPAAVKCLSYLYNNQGANQEQPLGTGPTYEGPQQFAHDTREAKRLFCLPTGELNPERSDTAALELARIYDNGFERTIGIDGVKKYLTSMLQMAIDERRNGNTDPDRRAAIRKCFGTNLNPLPASNIVRVSEPTRKDDIPSGLPSSFTPQANRLVGTVEMTGDYTLTMTIVPTRVPPPQWTSIMRFTMTNNNCCNFGDRAPAIWFFPGSLRLHIRIGDARDGNWGVDPVSLCRVNQPNTLTIICRGSNVFVQLNNERISVTQPTRRASGTARVFAGDAFHPPAATSISNFKYTPFAASVPVLFGPWIGTDIPAQRTFDLANGNRVYAIQQNPYTKMVEEKTGIGKYYSGTIGQFSANNWDRYAVAPPGNYRLKFSVPTLFGPWIGADIQATNVFTLSDGSSVYAIEQAPFTKMVQQTSGIGKYYTGSLNQFSASKWNTYTIAPPGSYRLKFV
jgi:hypothetical protein